jgi:hypothetical protein
MIPVILFMNMLLGSFRLNWVVQGYSRVRRTWPVLVKVSLPVEHIIPRRILSWHPICRLAAVSRHGCAELVGVKTDLGEEDSLESLDIPVVAVDIRITFLFSLGPRSSPPAYIDRRQPLKAGHGDSPQAREIRSDIAPQSEHQ